MPIRLDQRLTAIANLTDYGKVADVGCDHGKLGYYLISTDRVESVIATDISVQSLQKASDLARENGVSNLMQTRLGDGLKPVASEEVDTVIIAGLGGDVIKDILADAREENKKYKHFILCANTHPEKVRCEIVNSKHTIIVDEMIECAGKVYTLIKTNIGESVLDDMQLKYGAFYRTSDNFLQYANVMLEKMNNILLQNPKSTELSQKIENLKLAISQNVNH